MNYEKIDINNSQLQQTIYYKKDWKWTWALSPDGNAGFETSSRIGNSRYAMDCFLGLGRFVSAFINSVHRTVNTLYEMRYINNTLINLKRKKNE